MRFFLACLLFIQFSQPGWAQTGLLVFSKTSPKSVRILGDGNLAFLQEKDGGPRNELLNLIRRQIHSSTEPRVPSADNRKSIEAKSNDRSDYSLQGHKLSLAKKSQTGLRIEPFSLSYQDSPNVGVWKLTFQNSEQRNKTLEVRLCNPKKQCRSQHLSLDDWQREAADMFSNPEGFVNRLLTPRTQNEGHSGSQMSTAPVWFLLAGALPLLGVKLSFPGFSPTSLARAGGSSSSNCVIAGYISDLPCSNFWQTDLNSNLLSDSGKKLFKEKFFVTKTNTDPSKQEIRCNPELYGSSKTFHLEASNRTTIAWDNNVFLTQELMAKCAQAAGELSVEFFKSNGDSNFVTRMNKYKDACKSVDKPEHQKVACESILKRITELERQCVELRKKNSENATLVCTPEELAKWCADEANAINDSNKNPVCTATGTAATAPGVTGGTGSGARGGGGSSVGGFFSSLFSSEWFWPTVLVGAGLFFYWILTEQAKQQMRWNLNMWNQGPVQTAPPMYNPTLNPNVRGTP